jgi:hypothetical protein
MYYPNAFKKANEEIVRILGTGRLPTFDDRASLPYGMYPASDSWHSLIFNHFINVDLYQWNAFSMRLYVGALQFL